MAHVGNRKLRDWFVYLGVGTGLVLVVLLGTSYAPRLTDHILHWIGFAAATSFVFGYLLHDFWSHRRSLLFWLVVASLFGCHLVFWIHYVRPYFGGDPHWLDGGATALIELVIGSITLRIILPAKRRIFSDS